MSKSIFSKLRRRLPWYRELSKIENSLESIKSQLADLKALEAIRLVDFELSQHPRYADPRRLLRYQAQVCSQNAEDGILHEIFCRIGAGNKIFAEVGVGNGIENNTAFLLSQGWSGFWIDGSSEFLKALAQAGKWRQPSVQHQIAFVNKENIAGYFSQLQVPKDLDLMSLDIDQNTYYIWEALQEYRARVVVVEYNSVIPPDIDWKVNYDPDRVYDGTQNFGASLKAYENLGRQLGYSLVGCDFTGINAFFVRTDLLAGKFTEPFTSENHYEPPRYPMIHRRGHLRAFLDKT